MSVTAVTAESAIAPQGTGIRPFAFTDEDYAAASAVWNASFPEYPETPDEIRWHDEHRDARYRWARFLCERDGAVVAAAGYDQNAGMYHPRKFELAVSVLPDFRGRGIGSALYEHLVAALVESDPIALHSFAREDDVATLGFLQRRGFAEEMRENESALDVTRFDPEAFRADVEKCEATGIVIRPFAELDAADPDARRKLHALHYLIALDIPSPDPVTEVPFDVWAKRFDNPNFLPEGNVVALDGDEYVGTSVLWRNGSNDRLDTGMTGVRREWRKRGIATALKVYALAYAKRSGAPEVRTSNEQNNVGMLGINYRLGFQRLPAWVFLKNTLKDEGES